MKKIQFTLLVLLQVLFSNNLISQSKDNFGVQLSVVKSDLEVKDKKPIKVGNSVYYLDYAEEPSIHPSIGCFYQRNLIDNLGLELELLYLQKGSSENYEIKVTSEDFPDGTGETRHYRNEINLSYIQLGFNLQPKILIEDVNTFLITGISMNYLLTVSGFVREDVKKSNIGYTVGMGFGFDKLLYVPIYIAVEYNNEFSPFYVNNANIYNNVLMLNIGVTI